MGRDVPARSGSEHRHDGNDGRRGDEHDPPGRAARPAPPRPLARLDRALHRPLDPREDGRPGRARQRRAARALRRALGADVLADRRLAARARAAAAGEKYGCAVASPSVIERLERLEAEGAILRTLYAYGHAI